MKTLLLLIEIVSHTPHTILAAIANNIFDKQKEF